MLKPPVALLASAFFGAHILSCMLRASTHRRLATGGFSCAFLCGERKILRFCFENDKTLERLVRAAFVLKWCCWLQRSSVLTYYPVCSAPRRIEALARRLAMQSIRQRRGRSHVRSAALQRVALYGSRLATGGFSCALLCGGRKILRFCARE